MDDIPIRPSKEYLEQKEASQTKVAKTCTDYLKKSKPRYLPSATAAHTAKKPPSPKKPSPSKKEIYQRIKTHNEMLKEKYRSDEPIVQSKQSAAVPTKQTSGLNSVKQLKSTEVKPKVVEGGVQTEKLVPQRSATKAESYKEKYENMLKQLNQEKEKLEREKKELAEQKEYLEFKKHLKGVEGLKEPKQLKTDLERSLTNAVKRPKSSQPISRKPNIQPKKSAAGQTATKKPTKQSPIKPEEKFKREMEESKKLIESLNKKMQTLSQNTMKKSKNIEELLEEAEYEYTLADIGKIQNFSLQEVNKLISLREFRHQTNPFYRQFSAHFKDYAVVKQAKQGAKSIKQFGNGCKETEVAKKYRMVEYPTSNYRITLFSNGDVKQELPGPIVMYFSKSKQLNRINYQLSSELYYFYELGQLQLHTKTAMGDTQKEIRYRDGTITHLPKR